MIEFSPIIKFDVRRCYTCSKYWARETGEAAPCPYCADKRSNDADALLAHKDRRIIALRGALTRARKRRGRG